MTEKTDVVTAPQRRRPTGVPPPLPHPVSATTRAWLVLAVVVLAGQLGYSTPALSVMIPAFLLMGIAYCLVVPGRPRSYA